ncbi:MAG: hypothetical protein Q8O14_14790 [bacterium]|nr:hypothetical protein [bacterium]
MRHEKREPRQPDPDRLKAANEGQEGKPPNADVDAYDRLLKEAFTFRATTSSPGWPAIFGSMLADSNAAAVALKSCEKMNDVIRCQATIAYVEGLLVKLRQPGDDLNAMRKRYPLFMQEFHYRADFDELTGRVTLIELGKPTGQDAAAGAAAGDGDGDGDDAGKAPALVLPMPPSRRRSQPVPEPEDDAGTQAPEAGDPFGE